MPLVVISSESRPEGAEETAPWACETAGITSLDTPASAAGKLAAVLSACAAQSRPVLIRLPAECTSLPCDPILTAIPAPPWFGPVLAPPPSDPVLTPQLRALADGLVRAARTAKAPVVLLGLEVARFGLLRVAARACVQMGVSDVFVTYDAQELRGKAAAVAAAVAAEGDITYKVIVYPEP